MRAAKNTGVKPDTLSMKVCSRVKWPLVLKGLYMIK